MSDHFTSPASGAAEGVPGPAPQGASWPPPQPGQAPQAWLPPRAVGSDTAPVQPVAAGAYGSPMSSGSQGASPFYSVPTKAPAPTAPPRNPRRPGGAARWLAGAAAITLLAFGGGAGGAYVTLQGQGASASSATRVTTVTKVQQGNTSAPDWTASVAAAMPSTVSITVTSRSGEGQGSGVIWDTAGHVVTNNHVASALGSGATITVTLSDNTVWPATVVATDPATDLAVLQITNPPANLIPIQQGESNAVKVGDPVMAIGNPLGLSNTVTTGIVSALNRPVTTAAAAAQQAPTRGQSAQPGTSSDTVVTDAIQVSAAINPGNSGGALLDANGHLIGINFSIASLGAAESGNIGIGFAIPGTEVQRVVSELISSGKSRSAMLGVSTTDGSAKLGTAARLGAVVSSATANGPAQQAGIVTGDVIVGLEGQPVTTSEGLAAEVRSHAAGSKVTVQVLRNGSIVDVPVMLGTH